MILSWVLGHGTQIVSTVTQFSLQYHECIHCGVLKKKFYEAHKRLSLCTDKHTQATYPGRNATFAIHSVAFVCKDVVVKITECDGSPRQE